jgi:hypothetical protein
VRWVVFFKATDYTDFTNGEMVSDRMRWVVFFKAADCTDFTNGEIVSDRKG